MTTLHTRVKKMIQKKVIEDELSTSETTMLLVEIEATVVGTPLTLSFRLKIATRLGEVIALAACWAETVVGIVTSISYLNMIDRRPRA